MDALIEAVKDLEVAVDDYTQAAYGYRFGFTGGTVVSQAKTAVVKASTQVAFAMHDADVTMISSAYADVVIPSELRASAADAEIGALRHVRSERARKALGWNAAY